MNGEFSAAERALLRGKQIQKRELQSLKGWYPVVAGNDTLWWRFFGEKRFSEPFFYDTLRSLEQENKLLLQTAFEQQPLHDTLKPSAFIFHVSRCGSTLLTQLLASVPECIVQSEPPVIDSFLRRYHSGAIRNDAETTLRDIVSALGQKRFTEEQHYFIKLDSWHIASLPLFRRAFPATPFLFMYREPDEVIASHRRQRGQQMVPGLVNAAMPAFDFCSVFSGDLDSYCAKMLEYFLDCACQHVDELILINYRQMPHIVWEHLLEYFAIPLTPVNLETMQLRAGLHSKTYGIFAGDQDSASERTCPSLYTLYEKLEQLRLQKNRFHARQDGEIQAK